MNGFYPVLNEVHDKAVKDLPLAECDLFEHIWRKLIGWNKFKNKISISQLVSETSSTRGTIIRLTKHLEDKRWIIISREMDGKVNLTNQISIPECPGIKTKLGWCQNSTTPSVKIEPQVVSKQDEGVVLKQDTQQTVLTDSLQTSKVEPPKKVYQKDGMSDMVNIQKALNDKWGMFQVSDGDVGRLLSSVALQEAVEGQDPNTRKRKVIPARYAPLQFWFDVINRMDDKPQNGVNSIIKYGKTIWKDYKKQNKLA